MKVKLSEFIDAIDMACDAFHSYLNKETGEVVNIPIEDLDRVEEDGPTDDLPEWQKPLLEEAREIYRTDKYLMLPDKYDFHEYHVMAEFCHTYPCDETAAKLSNLIQGKGAFRRFKHGIYSLKIEKVWFEFKEQKLRELATAWCQENGLEWE